MGMAEPELEVAFFSSGCWKRHRKLYKNIAAHLIYFCKCTYIDNMSNYASRGSLFYILQKESLVNGVKPVDV
jgi:hypothetical protein